MSQLLTVIGLFSDALTTTGFFQGLVPESTADGATIRIKAGLPDLGNDGDSLSGSINKVYSYSQANGYQGQADGCDIGNGGICDVIIDAGVPGQRAVYVSVSNNNDATCIAWIIVQQRDGTFPGAWTGDIGAACGQSWYEQIEVAGKQPDGSDYVPRCTWLDADHTNDIPSAALKFDVTAYGENVNETADANAGCDYTIYGEDNGPLAGKPGAKRSTPERSQWMTEALVVSHIASHSAKGLCDSATSLGPDFVDIHGNFCDMGSKTLTPLCSSQYVDGCVELDEDEKAVVKRMSVAKRTASVKHKSYKKISKWGF
ncbi:uncharacterized protein J4E88_002138 [Alternaria novae-zelandiae]|uniref:uncharacterized protein n=1 Tax=Alternaria novae-zelandiae TaxID=430562 RepID=UPI0020C532CF|nr:uncharacterized protein J4E88_002138 [Alternaria novae-zelandiae]KAI4690666.1 hypothetical protein J4E88_002138 [Alternaria novae-zelandiae]